MFILWAVTLDACLSYESVKPLHSARVSGTLTDLPDLGPCHTFKLTLSSSLWVGHYRACHAVSVSVGSPAFHRFPCTSRLLTSRTVGCSLPQERHHYSFLDEDILGALPQLLSEIAFLLSPFLTGISICVCGILGCYCLFQDTENVTLGLLASAVTVTAVSMTSLSSHCFQDLCLQSSEASLDTFLL